VAAGAALAPASATENFDYDAFESRLSWIFGSPRTGSSWLLRLLVFPWELAPKHPLGFRPPKDGAHADPARANAIPLNEPFLGAHLTPMRVPTYDPSKNPADEELLLNQTKAPLAGYFFSDQFAEAWRPKLRELILWRFNAHAERAAGQYGLTRPSMVIKEPNSSHGSEMIMSLLPRSRFIFLLRDGRDVIDSAMDLRRYGKLRDEIVDSYEGRLDFVLLHARLWVHRTSAVQRAFEAHPADRRLIVRYEDLRSDTYATLRRLVDWIGLERSDAELNAAIEAEAFKPKKGTGPGSARRAASPGLWRENLTPLERQVMEEIMGEKLVELGYSL
jgi:hypothetical protein